MAMAMSEQWYPFANKNRDNTNDEFVDRTFVEKRSDDVTAAHHPDVLAFLVFQPLRERGNGTGGEFDARWH